MEEGVVVGGLLIYVGWYGSKYRCSEVFVMK
jgi:hypothetical protein